MTSAQLLLNQYNLDYPVQGCVARLLNQSMIIRLLPNYCLKDRHFSLVLGFIGIGLVYKSFLGSHSLVPVIPHVEIAILRLKIQSML